MFLKFRTLDFCFARSCSIMRRQTTVNNSSAVALLCSCQVAATAVNILVRKRTCSHQSPLLA